MKQPALTFALALLAGAACNPKHDTAKPDDGDGVCTEEAKVCPDGSSVGRAGPDCEFAACPAAPAPEGTTPEGDAPEGDAPEGGAAPETAPAPASDAE